MHPPGPRDIEDGTKRKTCRVNWGTSQEQPWIRLKGEDPLYEYKINRRKFLRDSDAAIVSIDPVGQHNPLASQGPLDWSVLAMDPVILSERTIGVPAEGE
jgi:hypothetical protein